MTAKKEFRTWKSPKAERQYRREEAAKQRDITRQFNTMVDHLLIVIDECHRIEAYGRDELLIKLAQAAGVRLYDDGIDGKLMGYAKRLGGERYLAIKAALYHIVDVYDDIELLVDKDSQEHTLRLTSTAKQQTERTRIVIEEDGRVPLSDHHRALLMSWREDVEQYV